MLLHKSTFPGFTNSQVEKGERVGERETGSWTYVPRSCNRYYAKMWGWGCGWAGLGCGWAGVGGADGQERRGDWGKGS